MEAEKVQITGEVDRDTVSRLRWLANREGVSLAEAIERAVANTSYLVSVIDAGGKVLTEEASGRIYKIDLR